VKTLSDHYLVATTTVSWHVLDASTRNRPVVGTRLVGLGGSHTGGRGRIWGFERWTIRHRTADEYNERVEHNEHVE